MRTRQPWIATALVVVLVGLSGRPADAESVSTGSALAPLDSRSLPLTLYPGPRNLSPRLVNVRYGQVAVPPPTTGMTGSHPSLKQWMWAGVAVGAFVVFLVLTVPRD